jgi:hypothetical protein
MKSSSHLVLIPQWFWLAALCTAISCATYVSPPDAPDRTDPCRPHEIIATQQHLIVYFGRNGSVVPSCTIDSDGVVTMQFTPLSCSPIMGWYGGCVFAGNQDLAEFDAVTGKGRGVIAVKVCVKGFVPSALNLRYGSPPFSMNGRTKYMPMITAEEQFTGDGCRLVYLSPSDACYSFGRCGSASGCVADDSTVLGNNCDTFARSQLSVVNEFCAPPREASTQPTVVTIEKITYYPEGCMCDNTAACSSPRVCRRDGWLADSKCANALEGCPGVCAP